jgi:uncharacterized protein
MTLQDKEKNLEAVLRDIGRLLVAYSGGVDSSYLAWKSYQVLGRNSLAVTGESASVPSNQRRMAMKIAEQFGFPHEVIDTKEMNRDEYKENPPNRCYYCKDELFSILKGLAVERGYNAVADGLNADDLGDFRPGRLAAQEHAVRSPLVEAGLTKSEIRELSRQAGLPTADIPASACLSSRFPYGVAITEEKLRIVDQGEEALREMGFRVFRVRHHEEMVRLEFGPEDLPRALNMEAAARLSRIFKDLGYKFVTLDLEGYRSGSLNEILVTEIK